MNKDWTFTDKKIYGHLMEANDFFKVYSNPSLPFYYDANFLQLKYSPTLEEFSLIETIYKTIQRENEQNHLKINWPDNTGIHMDVLNYLNAEGFKIGKQELMVLEEKPTIKNKSPEKLTLNWVSLENISQFLEINATEDKKIGVDFSEIKKSVYRYLFKLEHTRLLLATQNGQPVGSLILHLSDDFIEIDHVLTDQDFRRQGVASFMIDSIIERFKCPVVLVVDAEDTPKALYKKLGFQVVASQISALKETVF